MSHDDEYSLYDSNITFIGNKQIESLKKQIEEKEEEQKNLIALAQENQALWNRLQGVYIKLVKYQNKDSFTHYVSSHLANDLGIDYIALGMETSQVHQEDFIISLPKSSINRLLSGNKTRQYCGRMRDEGKLYIKEPNLKSIAMIRVECEAHEVVVIYGSKEVSMYNDTQDTDLLNSFSLFLSTLCLRHVAL